ncbi:hypothetical protein GCM10010171_27440 [Actinokineospora fastidiosa]|uniref:Uncharacterized protein n=1 Tax=Actinokineospora fastidiosa TaxID=1816 RepID=A0A918LCZ8_9PSEU|nr:hypothetical protein GCM10010171_27440 [Actinokineospora fastidiosa]
MRRAEPTWRPELARQTMRPRADLPVARAFTPAWLAPGGKPADPGRRRRARSRLGDGRLAGQTLRRAKPTWRPELARQTMRPRADLPVAQAFTPAG